MAVYTHLSAGDIEDILSHYGVGTLLSVKGIAEGVSNSNWLVEASSDHGAAVRYILTVYEERTNSEDLPFFLDLLDHLSAKGCPVPRTIHDRDGAGSRMVHGKPMALIEYLPGVSIETPTVEQAFSVGVSLADIHAASADFAQRRENDLGLAGWRKLFAGCDAHDLASINPALPDLIHAKLDQIEAGWPADLPQAVIHSDLFPDNVLMLGAKVTGLIDFYFACNDLAAYDLAVAHAAWSFARGGIDFDQKIGDALIGGYQSVRPLLPQEQAAMPLLCQAAAMRFIATRTYDWLHTPADALVTRKDPMDFVNRLNFYDKAGMSAFAFDA